MPRRGGARAGARWGRHCAAAWAALRWGGGSGGLAVAFAAGEGRPRGTSPLAAAAALGGPVIKGSVEEAVLPHRIYAKNTLNESLADFRLGAGSLHGALLDSEVPALFGDHLTGSREMLTTCRDGPCFKAALRSPSGRACTVAPAPGRPTCEAADPELCLETLMPLLHRAAVRAEVRVHELQKKLRAAELVNSAQAPRQLWQSRAPPRSGHAMAAGRLVDELLGFFLGVLERMDYNPRLAACLGTPVGQSMRHEVLAALEHRDAVESRLRSLRWNLASKSLVEGRHGWHSMFGRQASEVSEQATLAHRAPAQAAGSRADLVRGARPRRGAAAAADGAGGGRQ
ncbi:unnamed protein product [Prorocentrum cordatum]|uniref:Uncharacterized protein n=1 Tax=Prorocentrum cordatum TaxID=2364126 RepID=A0ABN9V4E0_9DINO|nr:unnamed protein product [Polarella glacialis]